MPIVEAVLVYHPVGLGAGGSVRLGVTFAPAVLQAVGDQLINEARDEADLWRDVDPGLAVMREAEAERLEHVLSLILPRVDVGARMPDLELVE